MTERVSRRKRHFKVTTPRARVLVITPLGYKVLKALERGTYKTSKYGAHKCPFKGKRAPT